MNRDFGHQFLTEPESFPGGIKGRAWGEGVVSVDFLGGPYRFHGCGPAELSILEALFGELCFDGNSDSAGVVEISILRADPVMFREFSFDGWENTLDLDFTPEVISIAGLGFMALIDLSPGFRAAIWLSGRNPRLDRLAVSNFFRVLAAYRLNQLGGALLHSAGLVAENEAYLFSGESGAGKSTLSKAALNAGMEILSDDLNAVFPSGGQWYAAKVPFAGSLNRNTASAERYPVRFLGFLQKSKESRTTVELYTEPGADTSARLIAATPFLNIDPYRVDRMLENIQSLANDIATGLVRVSLDDDIRVLFAGFTGVGKAYAA